MIRLQFVGMPRAQYRRLQSNLRRWSDSLGEDTLIRPAPSYRERRPEIGERELAQIDSNIQEGFIHLLCVPSRDARFIERSLRFDCRVVRLEIPGDLGRLDWSTLRSALEKAISYEKEWCCSVRPSSPAHPLLLPSVSFDSHRSLKGMWKECDCHRDNRLLRHAARQVERFRQLHKKSYRGGFYWLDMNGRRFSIDRGHHGRSPAERVGRRRFRYCFEVPPGFHFDVTSEAGGEFSIVGSEGRYRVHRANVDPWGSVRA